MLLKLRQWARDRAMRRIRPVGQFFSGDETKAPAYQNAIDLIPGWSCHFPVEYGLTAGPLPAFNDPRIGWAIERFGDLTGRKVLELGPLEASHTLMLTQAGAEVDAVESNQFAYCKCLIAKEILNLTHTRFLLGDGMSWLEEHDDRYDLIVASGVLYHMRDPLRLLNALARRSDAIYIWTVMVKDELIPVSREITFHGVKTRLYDRGYGRAGAEFCGGPEDFPCWMHRDDLLAIIAALGFSDISIAHEIDQHQKAGVPTFSVFARKPIAAYTDGSHD